MDKVTVRIIYVGLILFINLMGAGLVYLASKDVDVAVIAGLTGTAIGVIIPSPAQAARQRHTDDPPVPVEIKNTEENPAKTEEVGKTK